MKFGRNFLHVNTRLEHSDSVASLASFRDSLVLSDVQAYMHPAPLKLQTYRALSLCFIFWRV